MARPVTNLLPQSLCTLLTRACTGNDVSQSGSRSSAESFHLEHGSKREPRLARAWQRRRSASLLLRRAFHSRLLASARHAHRPNLVRSHLARLFAAAAAAAAAARALPTVAGELRLNPDLPTHLVRPLAEGSLAFWLLVPWTLYLSCSS